MYRKQVSGSVLIIVLVFVSISLLLAITIFKLRFAAARGAASGWAGLIEKMERETILHRYAADIINGNLRPQNSFTEEISTNNVRYRVSYKPVKKSFLHNTFSQYALEVSSPEKTISMMFEITPVIDFFCMYQKDLLLSFQNGKYSKQGPMYCEKFSVSLDNAEFMLYSFVSSRLPPLITPHNVEPLWDFTDKAKTNKCILAVFQNENKSDSAGKLEFVINNKNDLIPDDFFLKRKLNLKDLSFFEGPIQTNIPSRMVKVINNIIDEKTICFTTTTARSYTSDRMNEVFFRKEIINTPNELDIYIIPLSYSNDLISNCLLSNPEEYADSINAKKSYIFDKEQRTLTFLKDNEIYEIPVEKSMVRSISNIQLFTDERSYISKGRKITSCAIGTPGDDLSFTYNASNRIISITKIPNVHGLARSDGRKTQYSIPPNKSVQLIFADFVPVPFSFHAGTITLSTPPPYGAYIHYMSQLPVLFIRKAYVSPSSTVLIDKIDDAVYINPSEITVSRSLLFTNSVFIDGICGNDFFIISKKDVYIQNVQTMYNANLHLDCRTAYIMPGEKVITGVVVRTTANAIIPLNNAAREIFGTFIYLQDNELKMPKQNALTLKWLSPEKSKKPSLYFVMPVSRNEK